MNCATSSTGRPRVSTRAARLRHTAGIAAASILLTACGSTVAMTTTTTGDGLTEQQQPGGSQAPDTGLNAGGSAPGTRSAPLPDPRQGSVSIGGSQLPTGNATGNPSTGAVPSGRAPTGPLKFGLLDVGSSTQAVGAIGAAAQTSVNEKDLSRAFIKYFNAHGGIAGRKLQAVEYTQDPNSSNYATDMEAACAKFTQDNKVSVVLRAQLGGVISENYENCLTKAGVASVAMTFAAGDNTLLNRHPGLYNVSAPSVDRRMRGVLTGLTRSGFLSSKNKIGVLVEDCPESQQAYKNTVVPLARSLGLNIQTRSVGCLQGFSDVAAFSAQVQSAVLPFHTNGVDRVTFVSTWEILMLLFFDTAAGNQGWRPLYGLSSNSPVGSSSGQFTNEQFSRMRGIGWAPNSDTRTLLSTATAKKCDAIVRSQGLNPQTQGDVALVRAVCDLFLVFKAAVEAAGGRDDPASLSKGLALAAMTHQSAALLGGKVQLGQGRQNAPTQVAEFGFVSDCSCFRYVGPARPLP